MADSETKICQNCKKPFAIDASDFSFYNRIQVPPPTWCPECRMVRRMNFRNERALYKNRCAMCGITMLSVYREKTPFVIYCHDCWWSDKWDATAYGWEYDLSKSFFPQFRTLLEKVPRSSLSYIDAINSHYVSYVAYVKNCYLTFGSHDLENVMYGRTAMYMNDSVDILFTDRGEMCYETINCDHGYRVSFSRHAEGCSNSFFLFDCRNCSNCVACVGLRNKSHCIFNTQYTQEEYENKLKQLDLGSFKNLQTVRAKFYKLISRYPHRFAMIRNSVNVTGDDLRNAKNCHNCFFLTKDAENNKFCAVVSDSLKDSYDVTGAGLGSELSYEEVSSVGQRCSFGHMIWYGHDVILSENCHNANNLFGCVGLRNKNYCILNKQYTKQDYEKLVPKIIEHMNTMPYIDQKGRVYKYGEFFPPELSPFSYNETIAQEYFPLTKEQAIEQGYSWKDPEPRNYQIQIKNDQIPDHIKDVKDDIIGQVIECGHAIRESGSRNHESRTNCNEQCTEAFKIIPQELEFYRKMNLPLPRLCPNCRHYQRIKQRNPLKLWHRKCECQGQKSKDKGQNQYTNTAMHLHGQSQCPNEFETSYAPERSEIVYCESCYNSEVV